MNNKTKILFTGGNGTVARNIIENLNSNKFEVSTLGKSKMNNFEYDLTKYKYIELNHNVLIHAAGIVHNKNHSNQFDHNLFDYDLKITKNITKIVNESNIETFIFFSSVSVYGSQNEIDILENNDLKGVSSYAKSKIFSEKYFKENLKSSVNLIILRFPLIITYPYLSGNLSLLKKVSKYYISLYINKSEGFKSIAFGKYIGYDFGEILNLKSGIYNYKNCDLSFNEISKIYSKQRSIAINLHNLNFITNSFKISKLLFNKLSSNITINTNKIEKQIKITKINSNELYEVI